ncbi:hypothetical protein PILCRDRAFT_251323 [Piloderma croceum F 1598]|uniref:Uncharacterized protein n=1 Tax=Piloderma croceum (strain F 1598) TaxID=765440 RepID=A0A0C3FV06_PILCF|nr:hypothetical protein PILCRDRAFT_251323 [Piloderma croceum F 1598]
MKQQCRKSCSRRCRDCFYVRIPIFVAVCMIHFAVVDAHYGQFSISCVIGSNLSIRRIRPVIRFIPPTAMSTCV